MEISQAIEMIQQYQAENALPGFLEAVIDMQYNRCDLSPSQIAGLNLFMAQGRAMFAPAA